MSLALQFFVPELCAANVIVNVFCAYYAVAIVWSDCILFQQSVPLYVRGIMLMCIIMYLR